MFLAHLRRLACLGVAVLIGFGSGAAAQQPDPFEHGWTLDSENSEIRFLSVKKGSIAESSRFTRFEGGITPGGQAQIRILLDSVDTEIDLRNVRMRFLFFESFKFPEATITTDLAAMDLAELNEVRRKIISLPFTLSLHGINATREADVAVTLMSNDRVAVANTSPLVLALSDFDLETGRAKLQEAADVDILPFGFVSFDFVFERIRPGTAPSSEPAEEEENVAMETSGDFDREACVGRFEILSRTGNITFGEGSARLDPESHALLDTLYDIVQRCPDLSIEIGGHTDSIGSETANQRLSERRAQSVQAYLTDKGIAADRLIAVGYGESQPVASNDTAATRARNRRIEFKER